MVALPRPRPQTQRHFLPWISMAAALAPAVWLGSEACLKNRELAAAHEQLRVLTAEEQRLDTALAFLRGPETRRAGTREDRNKPRGLYFVKRTGRPKGQAPRRPVPS